MVVAPKGVAVGLNKGHIVHKVKNERAANKKAGRKVTDRVKAVRAVIREVAGFSPYERRLLELLKVGRDRRALRLAKKRLGSHTKAKAKREEMGNAMRAARARKAN